MGKSKLGYMVAIGLIAYVFCSEPVFASTKANEAKSLFLAAEMGAVASDSVIVDKHSMKVEDFVLLAEPMRGESIASYLKKNIKYPSDVLEEGVEGYVKVLCTVEKNGTLSSVLAIEGSNDKLTNEVIKTLRKAKIQPVIQNNQAARYNLMIPVNFTLSERPL